MPSRFPIHQTHCGLLYALWDNSPENVPIHPLGRALGSSVEITWNGVRPLQVESLTLVVSYALHSVRGMTFHRSRISEGSCFSCRKRRLRCDLVQPTCSRCQKQQQPCVYGPSAPLRWVGGMATRGRLASFSSHPTQDNLELTIQPSPSPSPSFSLSPEPDLIAYFNNVVLPRFHIPDKHVELDYDLVVHNESLQQAVLAVSKAHYRLNAKDVCAKTIIVRKKARHDAIESFRGLLEAGVTSDKQAQRLFTINVLLCILEGVIEPSDDLNASICHLRGGFAILNNWQSTAPRILLQDGLDTHLLSIFTTMDLVHGMLSGDKPFFDPVFWHMFANVQTWWGCLRADDPFLGILEAFADMASLGSLVYDNLPDCDDLDLVQQCLPAIERNFTLPITRCVEISSAATDNSQHWSNFCATYQCCGAIYMHRALRLRSIDDEAVQAATRRGVELLVDEALPGMLSHCLIFPILVIGAHCIYSQDRRAVLKALSPSSSYLSFGSLQLMVKFLEEHWLSLNPTSTWWQVFDKISDRAFFF